MKKITTIVVLCATLLHQTFAQNGNAGPLTWRISDSTLTIGGSGQMLNYTNTGNRAPWYYSRNSISAVVVGDSVTSIGNFAFFDLNRMADVTIGNSVQTIGTNAFASCNMLSKVINRATTPQQINNGQNPFQNMSMNTYTLFVPAVALSAYQNANIWKNFGTITAIPDSVIELTFAEQMEHIFQHVNKNQIPTGLLSDWGLQLVEPYAFDGTPSDTNFVTMDTWRMLYFGMVASQVNNNITMTLPDTVFVRIRNASHATAVPLAMMQFQYNSINENSLHWIVDTVAEQIYEAPGATVNSLYLTRNLFPAGADMLSVPMWHKHLMN